jgi:hypothetical protein
LKTTTLVLWSGRGEAPRIPEGALLRAWPADDATAPEVLDEAAIAWTKEWGRRPLLDGRSFREIAEWKGVSLWWFAEIYLHHSTRATRYVRLVESFHRLLEREAPDEVEALDFPAEESLLLERTCTVRGVLFQGRRAAAPRRRSVAAVSVQSRWNTVKALAAAVKARLAGAPPAPPSDGRRTVLFLSHAAFWREEGTEDREHYFDRIIPGTAALPGLRPFVVAVGPRAAFRRRGARERMGEWLAAPPVTDAWVHVNRYTGFHVFRELRRGTGQVRRLWHALRGAAGMREAFSHRGVRFDDLCAADLAATLLLQLPWAIRSFEEMANVLRVVGPQAVCLYAESSGWGRAALAACRVAGVPTVALQHGILYPTYYSYLHAPDEGGCPRPDRTAVFGEAARRFLVERGGYAPDTLVPTGSPKFDALLAAARDRDRGALRTGLGVADGAPLVVLASRFRGIRETHRAVGSAFPGLVRAVEALGATCLVKPHPAEPPDAYEAVLRECGAKGTRLAPAGSGLVELLQAADVLVTVESLSAVEALVLERPVLILNTPTNLQAMVACGVALGVPEGDDPRDALRRVLFDEATRAELARARETYLSDVAAGVDGRATERILELLRAAAEGRVLASTR